MDMDALLSMLLSLLPLWAGYVAMGVGALVIGAEVVVAMTPSTDDDHAWEKIKAVPFLGPLLAAFAKLAPIQKKLK